MRFATKIGDPRETPKRKMLKMVNGFERDII